MADDTPATKKAKTDDAAITKAKEAWTDFLRDGVRGPEAAGGGGGNILTPNNNTAP